MRQVQRRRVIRRQHGSQHRHHRKCGHQRHANPRQGLPAKRLPRSRQPSQHVETSVTRAKRFQRHLSPFGACSFRDTSIRIIIVTRARRQPSFLTIAVTRLENKAYVAFHTASTFPAARKVSKPSSPRYGELFLFFNWPSIAGL
jgi:hypothetical protein